MITLSNGHTFEYMIASGALAFDGKGWIWERALVWLGAIKPQLFTVVVKSLTRKPRKGNLRWWKPWECVRLIPGGAINKVGLTNPGIEWWCKKVGPKLDYRKYHFVVSLFGNKQELVEMAGMLNRFDLVGIELNVSCPNAGHSMEEAQIVVETVKAVKQVGRHPILVKLSVDQDYLAIAQGLVGSAEAISLNTVPFARLENLFPNRRSPLWKLEKRVGGGGGGVSGKPAQSLNWQAVANLAKQNCLPVIAPSVLSASDIDAVRKLGTQAVSFGTIHLPTHPIWLHPLSLFANPCKPTRILRKSMSCIQPE
jgi:dihydroorotate dehydrogenase